MCEELEFLVEVEVGELGVDLEDGVKGFCERFGFVLEEGVGGCFVVGLDGLFGFVLFGQKGQGLLRIFSISWGKGGTSPMSPKYFSHFVFPKAHFGIFFRVGLSFINRGCLRELSSFLMDSIFS